jgi:hypothetical protein
VSRGAGRVPQLEADDLAEVPGRLAKENQLAAMLLTDWAASMFPLECPCCREKNCRW